MSDTTARREETSDRAPGLGDLGEELRRAIRAVGAHAGALYLREPGDSTLVMSVLSGVARDIVRSWFRVALTTGLPVAEAARERHLVWLPSGEELAQRFPRAAITVPYDFATVAYPLARDKEVLGGFFTIGRSDRPGLSSAERQALAEHARAMVDILERARSMGQPINPTPSPYMLRPPPQSADPGEALATLVGRLPEGLCSLDVNGRVTLVTDAAAELLGRSGEDLVGHRPWTALPWLDNPVYEDRYRAAVLSHRSTEFVALCPPDRWLSFRLHPGETGVSVLISPTEVEWEGEEPHTRQAPTRASVLYHILHLASALTEAASVNDVIDLVADEIVPAVGASALALFTHVPERRRLRLIGQRGFDPAFVAGIDGESADASAPAARAATTGVPGFFRSLRELEMVYPSPDVYVQKDMEGWAFLPLVASGRPIGACMLGFTRPHNFTVQERAVLNSLGGLIAQALERARLYDLKLDLARGLQAGMLPRWLPRVDGLSSAARYLPGSEGMDIGGDFYDLIPLGPGRVAAVIGDVQGHNVSAAALMGQLRTAVLAYATARDGRPGEVLTQTNRLLCMMESELFASCVLLRLDTVSGQVRMARAGHPEPLLSGPDGGRVLESPDGLLLGIDPDAEYPETEFELPTGATLALYTDGLVEAPGTDLDEAKAEMAERLATLHRLPVDRAADELTSDVDAVPHRRDDIALLLLRAMP
ncbi:SpoIIE family protein phosphatase [Nocardiopsis sp. FIRDI 009]|uniref:SpoIIE family protein phosphatase n=1 Tax=Nocardiopsis sp. FIRDI 009 TaxID=714197 RepID=UPI000E26B2D7|nr:SpoIIE family protein phosphatase [Nocardiopsis sp. FIRDI 009]